MSHTSAEGTEASELRGADSVSVLPEERWGEMEFSASPLGRCHQCVLFNSVKEYLGFGIVSKAKKTHDGVTLSTLLVC